MIEHIILVHSCTRATEPHISFAAYGQNNTIPLRPARRLDRPGIGHFLQRFKRHQFLVVVNHSDRPAAGDPCCFHCDFCSDLVARALNRNSGIVFRNQRITHVDPEYFVENARDFRRSTQGVDDLGRFGFGLWLRLELFFRLRTQFWQHFALASRLFDRHRIWLWRARCWFLFRQEDIRFTHGFKGARDDLDGLFTFKLLFSHELSYIDPHLHILLSPDDPRIVFHRP